MLYEEWKQTPGGKVTISQVLNEAEAKAQFYREQQAAREKIAMDNYHKESSKRAKDCGLIHRLGINGALDEDYFAEVQFDIGYHLVPGQGAILEFVSLGGHDVTKYLPPNILNDIQQRINNCAEDQGF